MSYRLLNLIRHFVDQKVLDDIRHFHIKTSSMYVRGNEPQAPATIKPCDVNHKYLEYIEFSDIRLSLENEQDSTKLSSSKHIKKKRLPSGRHVKNECLDFENISILLNDSFGSYADRRRPYPSGGALYPIGFIVCVFKDISSKQNSLSIPPGIYQYRPSNNSLDTIKKGKVHNLMSCILNGEDEKNHDPNFAIIYINHPEKSAIKYRYKSYRLALMEVGSAYQSALETANLIGLEQRLLASFCDFELSKAIGLDVRHAQPCVVQIF